MRKATLTINGNKGILVIEIDGKKSTKKITADGGSGLNYRCVMSKANGIIHGTTDLFVQVWSGIGDGTHTTALDTSLICMD